MSLCFPYLLADLFLSKCLLLLLLLRLGKPLEILEYKNTKSANIQLELFASLYSRHYLPTNELHAVKSDYMSYGKYALLSHLDFKKPRNEVRL